MLPWSRSSSKTPDTRFRLVVLDLDSALQPNGALQPNDAAALRTVHALGVKVVLASFKPPRVIHRYWTQLGLGAPVIALNGALVYDYPATNRILFSQPLDPARIRAALQTVVQIAPAAAVGLECGDVWMVSRLSKVARWQIEQAGVWPAAVGDLRPHLEQNILELWIDAAPDHLTQLETALEAPTLSVMRYTDPDRLLVRSAAASRGWALSSLAGQLEVSFHEIMVLGDGGHDSSMLQAAALAVAVADVEGASPPLPGDQPANFEAIKGVAEALARFVPGLSPERNP